MKRTTILILATLLIAPASVFAAPSSFLFAEEPLASSSVPGNGYVVGNSVVITAPVKEDVVGIGGSVVAAGEVGADALFFGGSISVRAPVKGDLRAAGGSVQITQAVGGDLLATGYKVDALGRIGGSVFVAAANVSVLDGAAGEVTIYGNNVLLAGDFDSNVRVVAGGAVRLSEGTRIKGSFTYEAPEPAYIPDSVVVDRGVEYTSASYLPDAGTSRVLAVASIGIFLLVRIIGALILAGLLAGLFPKLAEALVSRATNVRVRSLLLTTLLGFATLVATPILVIFLALTFVGAGIAFVIFVSYALLVALAIIYAGVMLGVLLVRRFTNRRTILWHDGMLGMLVLSLVTLVPFLGGVVAIAFTTFTTGALLTLFFKFAFPHDEA